MTIVCAVCEIVDKCPFKTCAFDSATLRELELYKSKMGLKADGRRLEELYIKYNQEYELFKATCLVNQKTK